MTRTRATLAAVLLAAGQLLVAYLVRGTSPFASDVLADAAVATAFLLAPAVYVWPHKPRAPATLTGDGGSSHRSRRQRLLGFLLTVGVSAVAAIVVWEVGNSLIRRTPSGCAPVAGQRLVLLTDDKLLQNADNIVPVARAAAAMPAVLAALNGVSGALGAAELARLNKAIQVEGQPFTGAAAQFARAHGLDRASGDPASGTITVGAAAFVEQQTVGELYRIALSAAGYTVTVRVLPTMDDAEPDLRSGAVDVVPGYLSTFTATLNRRLTSLDQRVALTGDVPIAVARLRHVAGRVGLVVGEPAGASNQNGFAVTSTFADRHRVRTLSEFAARCTGPLSVFGGPETCDTSAHCRAGLRDRYGLVFDRRDTLDTGGSQIVDAVRGGRVSLGLVFTSDPSLAG